ncbi:MAG: hypothetical protein IIA45_04630 [Bacteroidetes bacterium]|nr:hypothetical protein [Bacteroidota bacterium]
MSKLIFILLFIGTLWLTGCSTDLDLTAEYKDIAVVYGVLNQNDSIHYIKVNKSFIDDNIKPSDLAKMYDKLYYDNLIVSLEEYKDDILINTIFLEDDTTISKEPGYFYNKKQVLYKTTYKLDQDNTYKIIVLKPNDDNTALDTVSAETPLIKDFIIKSPSVVGAQISWVSGSPFGVKWTSAVNGLLYQVLIKFHYTEEIVSTGASTQKTLIWNVLNEKKSLDADGGDPLAFDIKRVNFYHFLNAYLSTDAGVTRTADSMDFIFHVGSEVLSNYIEVNQAQTGLVQSQAKPEYTNVTNGIGIIASRFTKISTGLGFTNSSLDSIACGQFTSHLRFKNSIGLLTCD